MSRFASAVVCGLLVGFAAFAQAQVTFHDDFDHAAGSSQLWGNERGQWLVQNGTYGASEPNNNPLTVSTLPFSLGDLEFECDVVATDDGGIWLHVDAAGLNGVLLVLARGNMYWHPIVNGAVTGTLNLVPGVYSVGQNLHVRAVVSGDLYSAYVDGNLITTLTSSAYPTGRVGLYDFRNPSHNYDNIVLSGDCAAGEECCPVVSTNPAPVEACSSGPAVFTFDAAGAGPFSFAWQVEVDGVLRPVIDGENADPGSGLAFRADGAASATLSISDVRLGTHSNVLPFVGSVTREGCPVATTASTTLTVCDHAGDVDCNGRVDLADLAALLANFGRTDSPTRASGDLDGDGDVDLSDLAALLADFGSDCP